MNPFASILILILNGMQFASLDYQIARSLLENLHQIPAMSGQQIAEQAGVSMPRLIKFLHLIHVEDIRCLKRETILFYSLCSRQFDGRYALFDPCRCAKELLPAASYPDLPSLMQKEKIDQIVSWLEQSKRMIVVGSAEMASQFHTFQKNMLLFGRYVYLDTTASQIRKLWDPDDVYCLCSMTGRMFSLEPDLYPRLKNCPNRFFFSQNRMEDLTIQISSAYEGMVSYYLLSYYLDCILQAFSQRNSYVHS